MSCVWMLHRGHSVDGCVLASTLCKYDLSKGDLFVLSWARVQRVMRETISYVWRGYAQYFVIASLMSNKQ